MFDRTHDPDPKSAAPPRARAARSSGGFSLLEAMVALGILAIGVLGMSAGQFAAGRLAGDSRGKTLAGFLAQEQVETFHSMSADAVENLLTDPDYPNDPNNPLDPLPGDSADLVFNRSWTIEPDTPSTGVIRITVSVDWVDRSGITRTIQIQTLKAS